MENRGAKKKVLAFIDWYAPGFKAGGGQRAFANFVGYMKEELDFYIVTRNTDFLELMPYTGFESDCWVKRSEGEIVYYASEKAVGFRLLKQLLHDVNPDFAYVNGVYSYKFSILPLIVLKYSGFEGRILQGTYGMLAQSAIDIKRTKKQLFLYAAKFLGLYKKVVFHSASTGETADIHRVFGPHASWMMAPHFPEKNLPSFRSIVKEPGVLRLIGVARLSPEKNTLFALECLRQIGDFNGIIHFDLFGPIYNQSYWDDCRRLMAELPSQIVVRYGGVLDGDDVISRIMDYHCLFMPSRGENFGYVILESLMAGRPVLISDRTPWRDLISKKAGYDLPLDNLNLFVDALKYLVELDQMSYDTQCEGALALAHQFINNPELMAVNERLFAW